MRDKLPQRVRANECGIINLDDDKNDGTHWVAYSKHGNTAVYFDSYGDLLPPREVIQYLNSNSTCKINYNYETYQSFNTSNCGHLCLQFLFNTDT